MWLMVMVSNKLYLSEAETYETMRKQNKANCSVVKTAYSRYPEVYTGAYYGTGNGRITVDELACSGYESSIETCRSNPWLSHDCIHNEDVGIDCYSKNNCCLSSLQRAADSISAGGGNLSNCRVTYIDRSVFFSPTGR